MTPENGKYAYIHSSLHYAVLGKCSVTTTCKGNESVSRESVRTTLSKRSNSYHATDCFRTGASDICTLVVGVLLLRLFLTAESQLRNRLPELFRP
jgi:hypothetical protein